MPITSHKLNFATGRIGRTLENDQWQHINEQDVNLWIKAQELITPYQYTHNDVKVTIEVDWHKVTRFFQQYQTANIAFHKALTENKKAPTNKKKNIGHLIPKGADIELTANIQIQGKNKLSDLEWYPGAFLEKYLYDVFLILNLSIPGSCEFLNLKLKNESERFYLSAFNFELGYEDFLNSKKICILELPIETVFNWYQELNLNVKQKSDSPIERVTFSLLHLCKGEIELTSVIWIFHALETIYGTRVGEGFSNLIDRMSVLLHWSAKEKKIAKSTLRKLYDLRSSFVHGGFKVHHPMGLELFDDRVNDDYYELYNLTQAGFNLVVLSIQTIIKNGWFGIEVKEIIGGIVNY